MMPYIAHLGPTTIVIGIAILLLIGIFAGAKRS